MNIGNILITIAGIIWGIELIPQVTKTYKSKNVSGLSLAFFSLCLFAYLLYIIGNYFLSNWVIIFAHIPSLIGNLIMVILILKYKRKI